MTPEEGNGYIAQNVGLFEGKGGKFRTIWVQQ